jgi:hypothetical protein
MAFKVKDLMISDLSSGSKDKGPAALMLCGVWQISHLPDSKVDYGCRKLCTYLPTILQQRYPFGHGAMPQESEFYWIPPGGGCDLGGSNHWPLDGGDAFWPLATLSPKTPIFQVPVGGDMGGEPSGLAALKELLKQQLALVEQREADVEANLAPRTVEEVDTLTQKLQEAAEELKSRRSELLRSEGDK